MVTDGATPEVIAKHLKKVSHIPSSAVKAPAAEHPYYSFGKWTQRKSCAILLLVMKEKKGEQAFLDRVREELGKPEVKLRKVKED